jgi:hypothetical protein
MKTRKIILSGAIVVLLCIYIVQLIAGSRSPVKTFTVPTDPDTITFDSKTNGLVTMTKVNDSWVAGDQKYPVDASIADSIVNELKSIRSLSVVSKTVSDGIDERYGFADTSKITVTASKAGKIIRVITVGKASSTGNQTYIRLEKSNETLLASGSLHDTFGRTVDALRSKKVYSVKTDDITAVHVSLNAESYSFEKSGKPAAWALVPDSATGEAKKSAAPDKTKITDWVSELAGLTVDSWADTAVTAVTADTAAQKNSATVTISAGTKTVTVTVSKIEADKQTKYLCTSSESKYPFYITSFTAERFNKQLASFAE